MAKSQTQSGGRSRDSSDSDSDSKATAWLRPEQVEAMRSATIVDSAGYLAARNDAIIAVLYDTGLRVAELVALDVDMIDLDDGVVMLPASIQKQYPTNGDPRYTEIELAPETIRVLRTYLADRWRDSPALFPSRQADRMTTESVRNVVRGAARVAEIQPFTIEDRATPEDVSPHTMRHSVAYRMLNHEYGNTLYDVTKRLRHATIQTTERVYSHFDRV